MNIFNLWRKPVEKKTKQEAIEKYFFEGNRLTVLECLKLFHTTELRKVVCRINKKFIKNRSTMRILGTYANTKDNFKTYRLWY
jgi:hypothetical protein